MRYEKTYFELTPEEINKRKRLTPSQQLLVDELVSVLRLLPKSICLEVDEDGLSIRKRITPGSCTTVAKVRKKSLYF